MNQVIVVITAPISTTNITGLRICTRGSSFSRLSISARTTMSRRNSEMARRSEVAGCVDIYLSAPVEGEVELDYVDPGLTEEAEAAARGVVGDQGVNAAEREVANRGDA